MGSFIEINDTLQLTTEQGFPKELDYEKHKIKPFRVEDFEGQVFEFKNKSNVRIYKFVPEQMPVNSEREIKDNFVDSRIDITSLHTN